MANYVEEFVAFLGWEVDDKELEGFNKQVEELGGMLKKATAIVAGAAGALTALTAVVNETTAANIALAKSVGVSSEFLDAMNSAIRPLGFNIENVVDLVEEMNNKMGESIGLGEPMTAVAEATRILGLEFKTLRDMAPEDQFVAILEAAKNLDDQQAAVSAVDMLMGGEANKVLGFLRTQDESLLQIIQRQMQLNMLTEEGRAGAERFNNTFGEMKTVIGSAKQEFFGLIGEALSPLLESYSDWVAENNEIIKTKIAEWADRLGRALSWVISTMTWLISKVGAVVDSLGGMERILKVTGVALMSIFGAKMVLAVTTFIKMMRAAGTEAMLMNIKAALIPATIAAIVALFILIGEDLYQFFTGGESALGKLGEKIAGFAHENVRPSIANFLGMTPEELDMELVNAVEAMGEFWDSLVGYAEIGIEKVVEFVNWLVDAVVEGFNALTDFGAWVGDSLAKVVNSIKSFFQDVGFFAQDTIKFFREVVDSFVSFISSIPDKIIAFVKRSVSGVGDIVRGLPLVGSLFGDSEETPRTAGGGSMVPMGSIGALSAPGAPTASPGARAAVTNANNSRRVTQSTRVSNQFNITQNPGESGEALASRVADEIQKASARAVSVNDSGIEV